ncbi:Serine--tRNA ligase [Lachnellula suecica]|uniref:serine--tRNA ligase n=1 Tax=Lachnellula suecica TaxID=602035 RepID=A0A8T9C3V7_9HELO|nr:Serine--tRNA ligase [Lachnellula suecica]
MSTATRSFTCLQCRFHTLRKPPRRLFHSSPQLLSTPKTLSESQRLSLAPKVSLDIKHIRQNEALHTQNCIERNYRQASEYPARISSLYELWHSCQHEGRDLRERNNVVKEKIANMKLGATATTTEQPEILQEAKALKNSIAIIEQREAALKSEIDGLAASMPNFTSDSTPRGNAPKLLRFINAHPDPALDKPWRSHMGIGKEMQLLDFVAGASTTGWGWYYLLNEAALLEQALVQYALSVARKAGWGVVAPPSMVYSHMGSACGFQPRDQNGEQQVYSIQQNAREVEKGKPELSLAGTAEIPLAGMKANTIMEAEELPSKRVGVSRCYRAEAGARGVGTKGLYRVHEFTKVELFAWTMPSDAESSTIFDEMVSLQTTILSSLGLHCRVLEMPSIDLGASATRKIDMEAFFPSRRALDDGWGEVTSVSTCTDYQSRRLGTRVRVPGDKLSFPYTVNGTALAVPRVLAAILENGWDEGAGEVRIPECLWPWMDGIKVIAPKTKSM